MYMRNVRLDHRPIFTRVSLFDPCSFRDMPPPCSERVDSDWVRVDSGVVNFEGRDG